MTIRTCPSVLRRCVMSTGVAACTTAAVLLWSPGALAAAGCTTTTPSIGQTIVCSTAGTETITIPTGADYATVEVIGGGGGSGTANASGGTSSGPGGNGASVSASLEVGSISTFDITVGAGGAAGFASGGGGGGYSRVQLDSATVIVSGGGGGGGRALSGGNGGAGGSGASGGSAAGGDGQSGPPSGYFAGGGGGNTDGLGSGGSVGGGSSVYKSSGASWASGGTGGGSSVENGGRGGSGYGGGGSGGSSSLAADGASGGGAGGSFANPAAASEIVFSALGASAGDATAGAGGGASPAGTSGNVGRAGSITITFFIRATPNTDSSSPSARSILLNMSLPSDVQCDFRSIEASIGSWVQLPDAGDCRSMSRMSSDQPTLLGWATDPDFAVAIAQRQVDNGWGAYQTFNNDGDLTGVFIPAGGYAAITGDTNLYPIWSA